ncbi:MAG TPA: hypothetical protein VD815_06045 [Candidatus Saccharimonadales bacterium]|nr:hypothetical protein [Candidatus Saccharimonadales bacterium]
MKTLILFIALLIVLLFYIPPIIAEAIPSDQRAVMIKSWALPVPGNQDSNFAITSSFSGNEIYFVDSSANKIGRLIPQTNTITYWDLPTANSFPTSIEYTPSGSIYYIDSNSNKIGRLVPETNTITEWNLPSNSSSNSTVGNNSGINDNIRQLSSLSVDASTGSVYFVESNTNKIGRLAPETNTITEWTIQSNGTRVQSMTLGFGGNEIYFVDSSANKIGRLAPTTNLITQWDLPTANSFPTSVKFDPSTGSVYFVESNTNKIGRLLPFYNEFTEWSLQEKPYNIEIDSSGSLHYIVENGTKIVRMD